MLKKTNIASVTVVISLILFSIVTGLVFSNRTVSFDNAIYESVSKYISTGMTIFNIVISEIGDAYFIIIALSLLLLVPYTRKIFGIPIFITLTISNTLMVCLKHIFIRMRPIINPLVIETGFSFPSGHSMNNMAIYTVLVLLIWRYFKKTNIKIISTVFAYTLVFAIGLSRIYLGVHYPSDIIGGFLMGFSIALTVYMLIESKLVKLL